MTFWTRDHLMLASMRRTLAILAGACACPAHLVWLVLFAMMCPACSTKAPHVTSQFRMDIGLTDPSRGFKLRLVLVPYPPDPYKGLIFVERSASLPPILEYREQDVLRRALADSVIVSEDDFETLITEVRKTSRPPEAHGSLTIRLVAQDSLWAHEFTLHEDPAHPGKLADRILDLLHVSYPPLEWMPAQIRLRRTDRTGPETTEHAVDLWLYEDTSAVVRDGLRSSLDRKSALDICRAIETNNGWQLPDDSTYAKAYPQVYVVDLRRGSETVSWRVFAPSRLRDKRYYQIVTAIETAGEMTR